MAVALEAELQPNAYVYSAGPPRANHFARDAAASLWGVTFPMTTSGFPITSKTMAADFERLGFMELDEDSKKAGTIVVWEHMMGIVTSDSAGHLMVVYPSARHGGTLAKESLELLGDPRKAKFLVPKDYLVKIADSKGGIQQQRRE